MEQSIPEEVPYGWSIVQDSSTGILHIVPTHDNNPHFLYECTCNPRFEDNDTICIHNSFDGREAFENKEREKS